MGVNAVTSVPTYTDGEILEASRLNVTNSGIPVFATTTTRDAAFGGTGEKTLAEGQFAYIEASNTTQYYDGAAWQALGGGLAVVQPETALTAAATFTLDGCFTSSYTNYRLVINMTAAGASAVSTLFQLRASGVTAATNYNSQRIDASSTTVSAGRLTGQTSFDFAYCESDYRNFVVLEIYQPQLAQYTNFSAINAYSASTSTTNVVFQHLVATHSAATAYDGFIVTFSGTTATGSYTLYGYGK